MITAGYQQDAASNKAYQELTKQHTAFCANDGGRESVFVSKDALPAFRWFGCFCRLRYCLAKGSAVIRGTDGADEEQRQASNVPDRPRAQESRG